MRLLGGLLDCLELVLLSVRGRKRDMSDMTADEGLMTAKNDDRLEVRIDTENQRSDKCAVVEVVAVSVER